MSAEGWFVLIVIIPMVLFMWGGTIYLWVRYFIDEDKK